MDQLSKASTKKTGENTFWNLLKEMAINDIIAISPEKIDSDVAVGVYYSILKENEDKIPKYFKNKLPSNGQERYRVINRNIFTSNAFHKDGIARNSNIRTEKVLNEYKKGYKIVYEGVK